MPYSYTCFDDEIPRFVADLAPASILDVGPGAGKWGLLLAAPGRSIDAVEIHEPYIEKFGLREIYGTTYLGDVCGFTGFDRYDLVLIGDVLEHLSVERAQALLARIASSGASVLLLVPYQLAQDALGGVESEVHLQPDLTPAIVQERYPGLSQIAGNQWQGVYFQRGSKPSCRPVPMRFHVVGLPHTDCNKAYVACPFTQQVRMFCHGMTSLGHTVYHYGGAASDPECVETVPIATAEQREEWFGGTDWHKDLFANDFWNHELPQWKITNEKAIEEIKKRIRPRDFICVIGGRCNKEIADAFPEHKTVEFSIGFTGSFSMHRVFVSYALMNQVHGMYGRNLSDYSVNDEVIPLSFDPTDFPFSAKKDDYFLFIGRVIKDKGPHVAAHMATALGSKLLVAGNWVVDATSGRLVTKHGLLIQGNVEYVGNLDVQRRGELMSRARAVVVPSEYCEPFGAVVVEAMLCGTPVISTDWGAFPETIQDGVNGFRCRTLGEMVWAGRHVGELFPEFIRANAIRYSVDVLKYRYEDYFRRLLTLWGQGWYDLGYDGHLKRERGGFR